MLDRRLIFSAVLSLMVSVTSAQEVIDLYNGKAVAQKVSGDKSQEITDEKQATEPSIM